MSYLITTRIFGFFNFKQATYVITDAEIIKRITIKDFDHFVNHNEVRKLVKCND